MSSVLILGGGVTGLAAGRASGAPVYEARDAPGGICASYYMKPGGNERLRSRPDDASTYRFEIGGGHWIFGGDPAAKRLMRRLVPMQAYRRQSAVYLPSRDLRVPYPLQNHLSRFDDDVAGDRFAPRHQCRDVPCGEVRDRVLDHLAERGVAHLRAFRGVVRRVRYLMRRVGRMPN